MDTGHGSATTRHVPALVAGLLVPGAGFVLRGRPIEALLAACAVGFFALYAAIALTVENLHRKPLPLQVWSELFALEAPVRVPPEMGLALGLCVLVHVVAAVAGSRAGTASAHASLD
jgi:hypothetical protein